jgi:hypothetical protein
MTERIAFFDVENAPSLVYVYDFYKENNVVSVVRPWFMLSFAWKHPDSDRIYCKALPDYPNYKRDKTNDRELVTDLWNLFNEHDILVGHNIKRFDVRKANTRFIKWGLKPPSPCVLLDSLVEYRKITHLERNNLDYIDRFNGGDGKMVTTGWDMHEGAINGRPSAWRMLKEYNRIDVLKAEKNWNVIAPWKKNHPAVFNTGCPVCAGTVHRRGRVRQTTKFQFHCSECGHWFTAKAA